MAKSTIYPLHMLKLQPFQSGFTILYLLGLNPFISFADLNKKRSKIITFVLRSLNILLSSFLAISTGLYINSNRSFIVFGHLVFAFDVGINFVAVLENLGNLNATYRILQTISYVIDLYVKTFEVDFPYAAMKKSIRWNFLLIVIAPFLSFIGHYRKGQLTQSISWFIFNSITGFHVMHLLFYIEFMKLILAGLNDKIAILECQKSVHWRHERTKELLKTMHRIKLISFKICRIAHTVNSLFGWFCSFWMLENATKFIYYSHNIYVYANEDRTKTLIQKLRKYTFPYYSWSLHNRFFPLFYAR